jgi:ATP-dependent exoDNAse (exonuclease V) alpha subunit
LDRGDNGQAFYGGDRIVFTKNSKAVAVKNGTFGTIHSVRENHVTVKLDNGLQKDFSAESYLGGCRRDSLRARKAQRGWDAGRRHL